MPHYAFYDNYQIKSVKFKLQMYMYQYRVFLGLSLRKPGL